MSDFSGFTGEDGGLSTDDFIRMLVMRGLGGGQVPGKSSTNRLSYLKSFIDFMGVPFEAMFGQNPIDQQPEQSKQRAIYGGDPAYAAVFDQIDAGQAPGVALKNVGVSADDQHAYQAAVDYATEKATRKPVTDWSSHSEYDLLGQPTEDDFVKRIANSRHPVGMGGTGGSSGQTPTTRMQDLVYRAAAKKRLEQAKGTTVRSDAQQDLVRLILATRAATGD